AHLLADPQPGASRDAPPDEAMLEPGAGLGCPGPRTLRRGAPTDRALEEAGRAVLRQRGRHPGTPRAGRRGRDRGHDPRRSPARGGPPATCLSRLSRAPHSRGRALPKTLRAVDDELTAPLHRGRALRGILRIAAIDIGLEIPPTLGLRPDDE